MISATNLQRFREELSFYVNETLDAETQSFMNDCLKQNPELQAEVEFARTFRRVVKSAGTNRREDEGLDRLLKAIEARQAKSIKFKWQRFLDSCSGWGLSPAFAVVAFVAVVQSVMLWESYKPVDILAEATQYRGMPERTATADIKLTISPEIAFGNLVILLRQVGAHIIEGPSESGELWIAFDDHSNISVPIEQLRTTPGIIDVIELANVKK